MNREMLKLKLEKELAKRERIFAELKELTSAIDLSGALQDPKLLPETGDFIIHTLIKIYRHDKESSTLNTLLLGLWGDMEKLLNLESLRKKLRFLDDEKLPEIYFAYTLLIAGETDPEVFGSCSNPMQILEQALRENGPEGTFREALQETVKEMLREKYRRQHMYEL
jgi:hypothetical protein